MASNRQSALDEALAIVVSRICPYCGKEFELVGKIPSQLKRKHCSQSCAIKSSRAAHSDMSDPWSDEEVTLLKSWIGKKPLALIQREWKQVAKKRGWFDRSDEAIHVKFGRLCRQLGVSEKSTSDNLSMQELSRQLHIPCDRVRRWRSLGLEAFESQIDNNGRSHIIGISHKNLRDFAASHPEEFWGIDQKRLSKALSDSKLAKHIHETVEQRTVGRAITVIRLDTGDVYRSAKSAAATLNLGSGGKNRILRQLQRDTPLQNGMDFARLDYPVYWVPIELRDEFNELAGRLFYELYLQLKSLDGYSKTSCQIVAGRMAVQITLIVFRKRQKQESLKEEVSPKQILVEYWQERFMGNLDIFLKLDRSSAWRRLQRDVRGVAYRVFSYMLPKETRGQLTLHLEEYALWYINYSSQYFFRKSYLPRNYQPRTQLEMADFFAYIYSSLFVVLEIKGKKWLLGRLLGMGYILRMFKNKGMEVIADLSGTDLDETDRAAQWGINAALARSQVDSTNAAHVLDDLLEYIKQQPLSAQESDRIQLYIAMKLEEASDSCIAKVLQIPESDLMKIESTIKKLASGFQEVYAIPPDRWGHNIP